ncbi:MAG: hypothetical protein RLZ98_3201 [Pseudomonadota bacterium]|jgi:putative (di)nucleoside polyphosphate hydrolase
MNSPDKSVLGYRPCVGIMVINRADLVWVGRRADMPGDAEGPGTWWQMPQGGIDEDEDPQLAAKRELAEETGMTSVEIIAETADWLTYDLPDDLIGVAWGGKYRGQKQKWFAMRFTGEEGEIDIAPAGHKPEFDKWKWVPFETLADHAVPFKKDVYVAVTREFSKLFR